MTTLSSDFLITLVRDALPEHFTRGDLRVGLVRNNYSLTNDEYFIKVAGPGAAPGALRHELLVAGALHSGGTKGVTVPAVASTISTPYGDISVWLLREGKTYTPDLMTPQRVLSALEGLHEIHATKMVVATSLEQTFLTVRHRQQLPSWQQMDVQLAKDINSLLDAFVFSVPVSSFENTVLCHGDAHAGNLLFDGADKATWCDFESARMAPPEWDIASLRLNVLRIGGRKDSWGAVLPLLESYDLTLVESLERMKACAGVTYLIAQGEFEIARQRVNSLLPMLDGEGFPETLSAQPGR